MASTPDFPVSNEEDFLVKYREITKSLKKRFLKKPNVKEAGLEFSQLARQLKDHDCHHYSAFCKLAEARCEHMQGNRSAETHSLVEAARGFVTAHIEDVLTGCCISQADDEYLLVAINCFCCAIKVCEEAEDFALAAQLAFQTGLTLRKLNLNSEAIEFFLQSSELQSDPLVKSQALKMLASCQIRTEAWDDALLTCLTVSKLVLSSGWIQSAGRPKGVWKTIFIEAQLSALLLFLLIQPPSNRLSQEHIDLISRFLPQDEPSSRLLVHSEPNLSRLTCTEDSSSGSYASLWDADLFIMLQSFVISSQAQDESALECLQEQMSRYLTEDQTFVLEQLMRSLSESTMLIPSLLQNNK